MDDGLHIASLILGFIYRHAKPILEKGYMYIAMPPLYSIIERNKKRYFLNQEEYDAYIDEKIFENYTFTENGKKLSNNKIKTRLTQFENYKKQVINLAIDSGLNKYLIDDVCMFLREHETASSKDIMAFIKSVGDFEVFKNDEGNTEINGLYQDAFINAVIKDLVKIAKKAKNILDNLKYPVQLTVNGEKISILNYDGMYQKVTPKSRSRFKGLGKHFCSV